MSDWEWNDLDEEFDDEPETKSPPRSLLQRYMDGEMTDQEYHASLDIPIPGEVSSLPFSSAPLPQDVAQARTEDLLSAASDALNPDAGKLTFEQAQQLGGPENPVVRELIKRNMVIGVSVAKSLDEELLSNPRTRDKALKIKAELDAQAQARAAKAQKETERFQAERKRASKKISFETAQKMGGIANPEVRRLIREDRIEGVKPPAR